MEISKSYNNILKQIVNLCREENHPVSEALVSYILNILNDESKIKTLISLRTQILFRRKPIIIRKFI